MINLESIEIHNDSDNDNNTKEKKTKEKKKSKKKSNIFETDEEDILKSDSDKNSNKINIDDINIGYPKTSDPNLQAKI